MNPLTVDGRDRVPVLKTDFASGAVTFVNVLPTIEFDLSVVCECTELLANIDKNKIVVNDKMTAINM